MVNRGDEKLDNEFDYYFYDRGDFQKKYFTEYERDRYDGDIETISILIKQLELFGEVIYEDDGMIMNRNIDKRFLKEDLSKVDELRTEMGEIGVIFLKYVFDNIEDRKKIEYLDDFRGMVMELLKGKGENTEELSTQVRKVKTDMERNIGDDVKSQSDVVDDYVFQNTTLIDKYIERIGFDRQSLEDFFREIT
tara:strand:+ start:65 stop:643 length:579 start_codon:yes stop_codon:yes gene_type:complete